MVYGYISCSVTDTLGVFVVTGLTAAAVAASVATAARVITAVAVTGAAASGPQPDSSVTIKTQTAIFIA